MMASTKHLFVALSLPFLLALASPFPAYAKKSEWEQLNKQSTALYELGDLEKAEETKSLLNVDSVLQSIKDFADKIAKIESELISIR